MSQMPNFYPHDSIPPIFYGNNYFDMNLIVIKLYGSLKLLKIFINSISLATLSYHYGFFLKNDIFILH